MVMTSTAATSASKASHFGRTAASASQVPRTTEAATAVAVPQPTAESSAARPDFLRYVVAIATIRNISIPSRSVTSSIWPIGGSLGGQDQFSVLRQPQTLLAAVMRNHELAHRAKESLSAHLVWRGGRGTRQAAFDRTICHKA